LENLNGIFLLSSIGEEFIYKIGIIKIIQKVVLFWVKEELNTMQVCLSTLVGFIDRQKLIISFTPICAEHYLLNIGKTRTKQLEIII
jgi:hypothetical protein